MCVCVYYTEFTMTKYIEPTILPYLYHIVLFCLPQINSWTLEVRALSQKQGVSLCTVMTKARILSFVLTPQTLISTAQYKEGQLHTSGLSYKGKTKGQ